MSEQREAKPDMTDKEWEAYSDRLGEPDMTDAQVDEAKPDLADEEWETYDPRDGSCSGCYWDGCTEDHPVGQRCVSGPEWDEDYEGRLQNLGHARLIAAAPGLLAALESLVAVLENIVAPIVLFEAKAAIAKARGGDR